MNTPRGSPSLATSTAPDTPRSPYHEMMNVVVVGNERLSMASSHSVDSTSKFSGNDPFQRHGRSWMLRFDMDGNAAFGEMSRLEVLKETQDAATPMDGEGAQGKARPVQTDRNKSGGNAGAHNAPYGTIIDVQRVHARDIRKLDNAFSVSNEPSIELRNQAILINADPVRAIIMRHCCLVFVPDGADSLLLILKEMFQEATHQDGQEVPFEFKALEALLGTLCRYFKADYEKAAPVISSTLDRLASGKTPSAKELETLRVFKNTMNEFESQVDGVRRALMEILDNEEDLRLLYLTKLYEDPSLLSDLWSFDSEEAEVLIENYLQDIFSTRTKANLMQHRIQNTESLVMLKLDSMRNYLLGVDILFSIIAISISVGTFIAGVFGMNLRSDLDQSDGWFWGVTIFSIALIFLIAIASVLFFQRKGVFA
ncbi:hypothetical protein Poli38472_002165 [Pythium oligandrum]|uniref:Magnesium transporter n=1 Tax=Pythium oligandrum TaxID=41045 RepID=A0A8K1FJK7_PYTOL|nr:hypothetical protein Poli38472_002165 [Pythium oligandrum]|eukprot:TMW63224.1 hypothetical protein Poli38472_002165 [Pythium oligandrum]